jgi:antitoxin CptB
VNADPSDVRLARIAWRCRRGMRELDLLLQRFLASGLESMDDDELGRLEILLAEPDQDILAWLTASAEPEDSDFRDIVKVMRSSIQSKSNSHE